MHRNDLSRFVELLKRLGAAFNRIVSDEMVEGYFFALADVPFATVEENALLEMRSAVRMPPPSALRRSANYVNPQVRALAAWSKVREEVKKKGPSEIDELTTRVLNNIGGWKALIDATTEQMHWHRKEFVEQFVAALLELERIEDLAAIRRQIASPIVAALGSGAEARGG